MFTVCVNRGRVTLGVRALSPKPTKPLQSECVSLMKSAFGENTVGHCRTLSGHCPDTVRTLSGHCPDTVGHCRTLSGHCPDTVGHCLDTVRTLSGHCPDTVRTLSGHCPDTVWTLSGHCPDTVRTLSRHCPGRSGAIQSPHGPQKFNPKSSRTATKTIQSPGFFSTFIRLCLTTQGSSGDHLGTIR